MEAMDLYDLVKQDENELEIFLEDNPELFTRIDKVCTMEMARMILQNFQVSSSTIFKFQVKFNLIVSNFHEIGSIHLGD